MSVITEQTLQAEYGGAPLTPPRVAEWLGVSERTVREMCATGELECTVTKGENGGKRFRIYPVAVRAWIRQHTNVA